MPYYAKKKTTYRRKPVPKAKKFTRRYKALPTLVKREIQKAAEVKRTNANPQTYTFNANNSAMSAPVDLPSLFCAIAQGSGDGERVGEQVRTRKAILKILVQPPTNFRASILQLFIGKYKITPGVAPTAINLTGIFDDGNSSVSADGTLLSLLRSINTELFTIYHYKKIKVGNATASTFPNNDFSAYRVISIDITKHLGLLKYTGSGAFAPTNKHFYMFCNWVNPDGTTTDVNSPRMQYYLDYTYTDM